MNLRINDLVAVSSYDSVKYGRIVDLHGKRVTINVGGNVITAEPRHVTRIYDKKLINKLNTKEK